MVSLTGVINDLHIPFHDERALTLVLDAFQDIGIDRLFLNGDILDFLNVSLHGPKNPDIQETLENEIQAGIDFIKSLRKRFPTQEIIFNAGNHEWRLDRFIIQKCPAFWNLFKVESMLQLAENNIIYYPYNSRIQLEKTNLYLQHSPPSYSSAKASYSKKHDQSSMYACSHRVEYYATTGGSGEVYETYFNGWLGDSKTHHNVFSFMKGHESWQQCASLIAIEDERSFHVQQAVIRDNKIMLNGTLYGE